MVHAIGTTEWGAEVADNITRTVAELPDRSSPEEWPEAMLVTADELRQIVRDAVDAASRHPGHVGEDVVYGLPFPPARGLFKCSNPKCGDVHTVDPKGHCPTCRNGERGWSCCPMSREQVQQYLKDAGIDVAPATKAVLAAVEKANQ